MFSYLIGPETRRHPRVLLERASAVIVALRVPLMMHQGLLKGQAGRRRLDGTLERLLVRRTGGPALESHGHGHRRARTEAQSRGTARLRRGPLMLLPGTPAASAHFPETRIGGRSLETKLEPVGCALGLLLFAKGLGGGRAWNSVCGTDELRRGIRDMWGSGSWLDDAEVDSGGCWRW